VNVNAVYALKQKVLRAAHVSPCTATVHNTAQNSSDSLISSLRSPKKSNCDFIREGPPDKELDITIHRTPSCAGHSKR